MDDVEILLALINEVDDYRTYPLEAPQNANQPNQPNERTSWIFNLLAEILVCEVSGEVVALGAQWSDDKIIVTFSMNQAQELDHVHQQLKIIWDLLKQVSGMYHDHPWSPCIMNTDKLPEKDQEKVYNLLHVIYKYLYQKYLSHVHKRHQATKSTRFQVFQQIVWSINPSSAVKELLDWISTAINIITQDLNSSNILNAVTEDFRELCGCFNHLAFIVKELEPHSQELKQITDSNGMLFNHTWCILVRSTSNKFKIVFPLECYLKKLTSLPKAIWNLLSFASSPHLHAVFLLNKQMEIHYVSGGRFINYPTPTIWAKVAQLALKHHGENPQSRDPTPSQHHKHSGYVPVHCKVAVAMHLLSWDLDGPPPLPFIGVLKLSCFGCWSFLKSLQHAGANIATRGTHGKYAFPWKYPGEQLCRTQYASQAAGIKEDLYSTLSHHYTTCILARCTEIGSDSSRCETEGNKDPDALSSALAAMGSRIEKYRQSDADIMRKHQGEELGETPSKCQRKSLWTQQERLLTLTIVKQLTSPLMTILWKASHVYL